MSPGVGVAGEGVGNSPDSKSEEPKVEMSSIPLRNSMTGAKSASSRQVEDEIRKKGRAKIM